MVSVVHASARVFRVRTEFIVLGREMRVHVLCECGSGAWIAAIAPFPHLFFDERPLIGRSVGDGLGWLAKRYSGLRILADVLDSSGRRGTFVRPRSKQKPVMKPEAHPRRRARQVAGQGELPQGELPQGELPQGELPQGELPQGELPLPPPPVYRHQHCRLLSPKTSRKTSRKTGGSGQGRTI